MMSYVNKIFSFLLTLVSLLTRLAPSNEGEALEINTYTQTLLVFGNITINYTKDNSIRC